MAEPLPAIELGGHLWWPVLISQSVSWSEGPGDPVFGSIQAVQGMGHDEWRSIDEPALAVLLAALGAERVERVLASYLKAERRRCVEAIQLSVAKRRHLGTVRARALHEAGAIILEMR